MHDIVDVRVVGNVDVDLLALANPQERPRDCAVIGKCFDDLSRREFAWMQKKNPRT